MMLQQASQEAYIFWWPCFRSLLGEPVWSVLAS